MSPLHHIHQFSGETLCVSTAGHTARHTADLRKSGFINSDAHLKKKQTSALILWTQTDFKSISDKLVYIPTFDHEPGQLGSRNQPSRKPVLPRGEKV